MARRPFDPLRAEGDLFSKPPLSASDSPKAASADGAGVIAVSALSELIRSSLEGGIGTVRVLGEMSNFRAVQGHWYFSLKDAAARVDCMMFRTAAQRCGLAPVDGIAVIATGLVTHYPPQGRTQVQCSRLDLAGAGDLDARFRQLCTELRGLGYFDESTKVAIPAMPMCIALLTSAGSAAEADCLDAAAKTFPATKVIAVDIRVQGAVAAESIARAIAAVDGSAVRLGIDVILLVRGGGSREDLWAFNERVVADAIYRCRTPIVTGIGHESDTSIADLVADVRAATPSRAVTEILPRRELLREQIDGVSRHLTRAIRNSVDRERSRLELIAKSRGLSDPATGISVHQERLARMASALASGTRQRMSRNEQALVGCAARLAQHHPAHRMRFATAALGSATGNFQRVMRVRLGSATAQFEAAARTLEAIGPAEVLKRGYSVTLDRSGVPILRASAVHAGETIETVMTAGRIMSVVSSTESNPACDFSPPHPPETS